MRFNLVSGGGFGLGVVVLFGDGHGAVADHDGEVGGACVDDQCGDRLLDLVAQLLRGAGARVR